MPNWLNDAVFYEIYPQSFCDTNGDGIGDIEGIISKLDYVKSLGCNAIWLNPIYDSPFMDAGYDVRNYKKVAERYGTNDDLVRLFDEAHKKGIKILLDLVPGHTSDQNEWFLEAKKAAKSEYSNRYIFTKSVWDAPPQYRMMCGLCERDGNYMVNYFSSQPALNYGFHEITHPEWQLPCDHPDCLATAEAMKDVMRFWLDKGADGFRVDMADSLVKNDDDKIATAKIWRGVRDMLDTEYPNAAMVAEWCNPERAINNAGFHMDFYLDHYGNGYSRLFRYGEFGDQAVFNPNGKGDIKAFADEYLPNYEKTKDNGYISFMTNNHDMPRVTAYRDKEAIKLVNAFIFTMPGVPFLYYGDEIGMRYVEGLKSVEGGYNRTGSRSPMQWDDSTNAGFSSAPASDLYITMDPGKDRPTAKAQMADPDSLYHEVKKLIQIRQSSKALLSRGTIEFVYAEKNQYPLAYVREAECEKVLVIINPSDKEQSFPYSAELKDALYTIGGKAESKDGTITIPAQSAGFYHI